MIRQAGAFVLASAIACVPAQAQMRISGAAIAVSATGSVSVPNDQATAGFFVLEEHQDKATAASRVNAKMKQAVDVLRMEDPQAQLKTRTYSTYPLYPSDEASGGKPRRVVGWRVLQYVDVKTTNLTRLPRLVAAGQKSMGLGLSSLYFGLSDAARRKADQRLIDDAYLQLNERVAAVAKTLGRNPSDAVAELIDFESGSGGMPIGAGYSRAADEPTTIEEPSFEPGESTLTLRITGRVKFR